MEPQTYRWSPEVERQDLPSRRKRGGVMEPYPQHVRDRAQEMRAQGMGVSAISKALGISRNTIYAFFRRTQRAQMISDQHQLVERAQQMLSGGMTQRAVSKALGVSRSTVYRLTGAVTEYRDGLRLSQDQSNRLDGLLLDGEKSAPEIAAEIGCHLSSVYKHRHALIARGKLPDTRRDVEANSGFRPQMVEMRAGGRTLLDIAQELGVTIHVVRSQLDIAYRDNPELRPPKPTRKYETSEDRARARRMRRREAERKRAAARRAMAGPRPPKLPKAVAPKPEPKPPMTLRPRVMPEPKIDRDAERRAVEAAIAAGIGRRFEVQRTATGKQIQTSDDAVAYLRSKGFDVEIKPGSHHLPRFRVSGGTSFDGRWMTPPSFVTAARAIAAQTTYRIVPLKEAYASQIGGA